MIETYSEYIDRYVAPYVGASRSRGASGDAKLPGEHHFVSVYLVPLLYDMTLKVPDYVNPDGMKRITGDIVYCDDSGSLLLGIEVKLGTISLSSREFNEWICNFGTIPCPAIFIGIGMKGLVLQTWERFRESYLGMIHLDSQSPTELQRGQYGPKRKVDALFTYLKSQNASEEVFVKAPAEKAALSETEFKNSLQQMLGDLQRYSSI